MSSSIKSAEQRRKESNKRIKILGITCFEDLPVMRDASELTLKSLDEIALRAILSNMAIRYASIKQNDSHPEEHLDYFLNAIDRLNGKDALLPLERKLFDNKTSDIENDRIIWNYEAFWALAWALGLIKTMALPVKPCDTSLAINMVTISSDYNDFVSKCNLRDIEEILDVLDLYYRLQWTCMKHEEDPSVTIRTKIPRAGFKRLKIDVVQNRLKGLEWLVKDDPDWGSLDFDY